MQLEVGGLTGAAHGEKSLERLVQRNGDRERDWETRAGTVELRIPKLNGSCFPGVLEPRQMAEKALTAVIRLSASPPWPAGGAVADGVCSGTHERNWLSPRFVLC